MSIYAFQSCLFAAFSLDLADKILFDLYNNTMEDL